MGVRKKRGRKLSPNPDSRKKSTQPRHGQSPKLRRRGKKRLDTVGKRGGALLYATG